MLTPFKWGYVVVWIKHSQKGLWSCNQNMTSICNLNGMGFFVGKNTTDSKFTTVISHWDACNLIRGKLEGRYHPRFLNQVGHQTKSAYIENKHFFTKPCHRQTYQNYEQLPQSLQNLYFESHFSASKINRIFLNFFFCEQCLTRRSTFTNTIFWKLWLLKYFVF